MTSRFELMEVIGRGGMGVVWKARDTESGEMVALKLLREAYAEDPDYIARFECEVETAQRIDSPHAVRVLGHGLREGIPFIAMEYVDGQSLRERLRAGGPMSWPEVVDLTRQLLTGLDAAHRAQVLHRDIKPGNILISRDGTARLADFGIAKALDMTALTGTSTMLGTPAYMAPDRGESIQTDLYSLGCVVYEMLAGAPPFEGPSLQSVVTAHYRDRPNLERLPPESRVFVGALLEKDARKRPSDAALALKRLPSTETTAALPHRRGRRMILAGTVVAATLGFGAFGAVFAGMGGRPVPATPSSPQAATQTAPPPVTATASPSSTFTPRPIATPSATPTATVSPTLTLSPTLTDAPTPTSTAEVVAPSPPDPTEVPTASPQRSVNLICDPPYARAGEVVTCRATAINFEAVKWSWGGSGYTYGPNAGLGTAVFVLTPMRTEDINVLATGHTDNASPGTIGAQAWIILPAAATPEETPAP